MREPVFTETLDTVAYLATDRELGVITENFSGTPGADLKPDATYP